MKKSKVDLPPDFAAVPGTDLQLGGKGTPLSPAQQRFNRLLGKIDKLKAQISDIRALTDAYRPIYSGTLEPLRAQQQDLFRRMALQLDARLGRKGLTATQKRSATQILCEMCETLAVHGDESMAALHDKHNAYSLREMAEEKASAIRAMIEGVLGRPLEVEDDGDDSRDPFDAMMRAGQEQLRQAAQAERDQSEATQARKKTTAAQRKAGQQQQDAETILRQVFRQLASALHPDRERDPAEHQRKTALMSEANAAYGRQDLVALLHMQLRLAQADPQALLQQPEERIAAMSLLLKQQAAELERELLGRREQVRQEFDLDYFQTLTATVLKRQLAQQEDALREELEGMAQDLQAVQDDAGLKRWLSMQANMSRGIDFF
jgi:hypothetical protein